MIAIRTLDRNELKQKLGHENFYLVETLAPETYRETHLPGAINLPPDRIRELAPKLFSDKDADIVVYCASPT